jgi:hypothetical protein
MKSHKNMYKTRAKKKKKWRTIKKSNQKGEKTIKCWVKKVKKRQRKNLIKDNKRKEPKIKVLTHELLASTLSYLMLAP